VTDPRIVELVRALPVGKTVWLSAQGKSLWPLVRSNDHLEVTRCGETDLAKGDLAITFTGHTLIAHLVTALDPVVTSSIVGLTDPPGLEVLGRVSAVRRGARVLRLPRSLNLLARHLPRAALLAKKVPILKAMVRLLRDERASP
jgi:hypothetical protein